MIKRAKVLYSYEPDNDDELKLDVDDIVDVFKQVCLKDYCTYDLTRMTSVYTSIFELTCSRHNIAENC